MNAIEIILEQAQKGNDLLVDDGVTLLTQTNQTVIAAIRQAADKLRQQQNRGRTHSPDGPAVQPG